MRVLSLRGLVRQPPGLTSRSVTQPETRCLRTGLAPANVSLHAPSTDSSFGLDNGPNWFAGHHYRGARGSLSTFAHPLHPCCVKNDR